MVGEDVGMYVLGRPESSSAYNMHPRTYPEISFEPGGAFSREAIPVKRVVW